MTDIQVDQALSMRAVAADGADVSNAGQAAACADRRGSLDRRRSVRGLLERRARREGAAKDRRRRQRRNQIVARVRAFFTPDRSLISR